MQGTDARFAEVHQFIVADFTLHEHPFVKGVSAKGTLFHVFSAIAPCRLDDEAVAIEYYSDQKNQEYPRQN